MIKRTLSVAIVFLALAGVASANVTMVGWESTDGDPTVANSVQNTLYTSMTADWTNAVILIDLTEGDLLNPMLPPPPFNDQRNYGTNENDTWVDSPNSLYGYPTINVFDIDGTITISGYESYEGLIDWFDTIDNGSVIDGVAARIYASDNAQGSWTVKMYDRDSAGTPTIATGLIVDGAFASTNVPEPASIVMILLGLATVAGITKFRKR